MTKKEINRIRVQQNKEERLRIKQAKELVELQQKKAEQKAKDRSDRLKYTQNLHEYRSIIRLIRENLRDHTNDELKDIMFGIRNSPNDLTAAAKWGYQHPVSVKKDAKNKTKEHFNGRTNVGIYTLWCILKGEIKDWRDLRKFYLKFCCWIYTSEDFNQQIKPFQNNSGDGGSIVAKTYIDQYEAYSQRIFSDKERADFTECFLHTKYGVITRDMVINLIRERENNSAEIF